MTKSCLAMFRSPARVDRRKVTFLKTLVLAGCTFGLAGHAQATVAYTYNASVANGVYFGTGNPNGGWTVATDNGYEIALRAKNYGSTVITPETGTGIYDTSTGYSPVNAGRAVWNWEFSINNLLGTGLDGLTATLGITHTGSGTSNSFDLLASGLGNTVGTNGTNNYTGATGSGQQNSENMVFHAISLSDYSPWAGDSYTFTLTLRNGSTSSLVTDTMVVNAVPEPAPLALLGVAVAGLLMIRRRKGRLS